MKRILLLLFLIIPLNGLAQQSQSVDTLTAELSEVVVTGYESGRSLLETPGSIGYLRAEDIRLFDDQSLLSGLNSLPGVRMEERAPGSYRISIRGSSLRSPFGIRNVKIYWNDIPFTDPSGSTPLNLLDVMNMKRVEAIKGPAGSVYGAGNGGALLLSSTPASGGNSFSTSASSGSFGLQKLQLEGINQFESGSINVGYANQHSDGYRDQSFLDREVFEISGRFVLSPKRALKTSLLYSDLNYGIPGGLNEAQFETDPTQDRPGNPFVLGSTEANASIDQQMLLAGFTHDYQWSDRLSNRTTLYGSTSKFENPFNLDYKKDSRKSGGGRTRFIYDTHLGAIPLRFITGGEWQIGENVARNFENDSSRVGALNFDDELSIRQGLIFGKAELELNKDWFVSLGLSYNRLYYKINRLIDNLNNDPGVVETTFDPNVVPRLAVLKKLGEEHALHGSISFGFSPPTIEEIRTNEGSINTGLQAEQGISYELGARGSDQCNRFNYDLTLFYFRLDETIVQYQSNRGTTLFRNAGNTDQYGLEAGFSYAFIRGTSGAIDLLKLSSAYTFNLFEYRNYVQNSNDFSGNRLPGVAPHSLITTLEAEGSAGWYWNLSHNFTDKIPLDDANTVYSDPYHLVKTKTGWRGELSERLSADIYFGLDNLLDERYSLGYDTNAFGGRYYQPAPERNWFAGLRLEIAL